MSKSPGKDLVEARVEAEQRWALAAFHARLTWTQMRLLALEPPERGGLGYTISEAGMRGLVLEARRLAGDLSMGREERVERQSIEVDQRMQAARADHDRARRYLAEAAPIVEDFYDPAEYLVEVKAWQGRQELGLKLAESADRRLEAAMKREGDLHGLNAPTRIEAEVTNRDGVLEDLNAALVALGREPVEVDA